MLKFGRLTDAGIPSILLEGVVIHTRVGIFSDTAALGSTHPPVWNPCSVVYSHKCIDDLSGTATLICHWCSICGAWQGGSEGGGRWGWELGVGVGGLGNVCSHLPRSHLPNTHVKSYRWKTVLSLFCCIEEWD